MINVGDPVKAWHAIFPYKNCRVFKGTQEKFDSKVCDDECIINDHKTMGNGEGLQAIDNGEAMIDGGYGTMGDGKDILMQSEKCPIVWSTDTWLL